VEAIQTEQTEAVLRTVGTKNGIIIRFSVRSLLHVRLMERILQVWL